MAILLESLLINYTYASLSGLNCPEQSPDNACRVSRHSLRHPPNTVGGALCRVAVRPYPARSALFDASCAGRGLRTSSVAAAAAAMQPPANHSTWRGSPPSTLR